MMIEQYSNLIGSVAALLTTIAFVPQVIHSFKTRDLSGVSLPMYTIFTTGVGLWLVYGFLKQDWPLILANAVTFCLAGLVLILKLKEKSGSKPS